MTERPDLAAMVVPLVRVLLAAEAPILAENDISMWAYVVLNRLAEQPVRGQSVLADAIGADKTRLIAVLDDLQRRGLIGREPDPVDRRARVLTVTDDGRRVHERVRRAIRREEQRLLAVLTANERTVLLGALHRLTEHTR